MAFQVLVCIASFLLPASSNPNFPGTACTPPGVAGGPYGTLKVARTDRTLDDMCQYSGDTYDVVGEDAMTDMCEEFCKTVADGISLPLVLGSSNYGFDLDDMKGICFGTGNEYIVLHDPDALSQCTDWAGGLSDLEKAIGEFIAKRDIMNAEKIKYRTQVQWKAYELQQEMNSEEFQKEVAYATPPQKLEAIRSKISSALGTMQPVALQQSIQELSDQGDILFNQSADNLEKISNFISGCSEVFLAWGQENEFLLDVCFRGSAACIDAEYGDHVGCCCGVMPATFQSGNYRITGVASDAPSLEGAFVNRRLTAGCGDTTGVVNACGLANELTETYLQQMEQEILAINPDAFANYVGDAGAEDFSFYYSSCQSGRRLAQQTSMATEDVGAKTGMRGKIRSRAVEHINNESRRLSQCTLSKSSHNLKVAISGHAQLNPASLCDEISNIEDFLEQECNDFCTPFVPISMGNQYFGVNREGSDSVCLSGGSDGLEEDREQFQSCMDDRNAVQEIDVQISAVVAQLAVTTTARLTYVGAMTTAMADIKNYVQSAPFIDAVKDAGSAPGVKASTYIGLVKARLNQVYAASSEKALFEEEMQELTSRVGALVSVLQVNLPRIQKFIDNCDRFFVGHGPENEYLLDICAQGGLDCFQQEYSQHASCCCAVNPASLLGESTSGLIAGIGGLSQAADGTSAYIPSQSRRLQQAPSLQSTICAKAWQDSLNKVHLHLQLLKDMGKEQLYTEEAAKLSCIYGDAWCSFDVVTTTSTTSTTATTEAPTPVPAPVPATTSASPYADTTSAGTMMPGSYVPGEAVTGGFLLAGVSYAEVTANFQLKADFESAVGTSIAANAGGSVTAYMVSVTLSPGSVQVAYTITLPAGVDASAVTSTLAIANTDGSLLSSLSTNIGAMNGLSLTGSLVYTGFTGGDDDGETPSDKASHAGASILSAVALAVLAGLRA
jgi:hypothetical protein